MRAECQSKHMHYLGPSCSEVGSRNKDTIDKRKSVLASWRNTSLLRLLVPLCGRAANNSTHWTVCFPNLHDFAICLLDKTSFQLITKHLNFFDTNDSWTLYFIELTIKTSTNVFHFFRCQMYKLAQIDCIFKFLVYISQEPL